jgi:hypothetical protein
MTGTVPPDILAKIYIAAEREWPKDREMQQWMIDMEAKAWLAIQQTDFSEALPVKDMIVAEAMSYSELWEERATFIDDQVEAFGKLNALAPDDVPAELIAELKRKAAAEWDWYSDQLEEVESGIEHYRYVQETRAKVGPIRDLLTRMEKIIGAECYNNNIQNYSSWGVWEGEGRSFRYPITFIRDGKEEKRKARTDDLQPEHLITGHYKFGANELNIYRALIRIIDMLETDYGFEVPRS